MNELTKKVEALLFVAGEGLMLHTLARQLKKTDQEITESLAELKKHLEEQHALALLEHDGHASLVTSPAVSMVVEEFAKEEFSGELTRAALETLAVLAYKGPVRRSDIDYVRGVNSSFMLRNLLMRGLIERTRDPKDSRAYAYRISLDFLKFLGLTSQSDLPNFASFQEKLEIFIKESEKESPHEASK